jgi:hypothetical protein
MTARLKPCPDTNPRPDTIPTYVCFDGECFILDSAGQSARTFPFIAAKDYPMTYLDIVFRYGAAPGENELRAIDGMREVYGIRRVQFNEGERTVRVEFDASRLKADGVARLLRQAGVDVRERLTLA